MEKWDLLIVGAGPAGLMAAKTAVEKGLKVLVTQTSHIKMCLCTLKIQ